jgi:hypothetical protein
MPQIAIASNGRIDIAFYDRRDNYRNATTDVGFTYSYDGSHFSTNVSFNRLRFSAIIGPSEGVGSATGPVDVGSHLALLSQGTSSLAAWTDTRNAAEGRTAQDIYSARATLLFSASRPRWAVPTGAGIFAAALAGMWAFRRRHGDAP